MTTILVPPADVGAYTSRGWLYVGQDRSRGVEMIRVRWVGPQPVWPPGARPFAEGGHA